MGGKRDLDFPATTLPSQVDGAGMAGLLKAGRCNPKPVSNNKMTLLTKELGEKK
jgi:hypothetical protein